MSATGDRLCSRAIVLQQKTQRPIQFEITPATREAVEEWIKTARLRSDDFLFRSRLHGSPHPGGTRQYDRIVDAWVREAGLDPTGVRCAFNQAHETDTDLSTNQEP